MKTVTNLEYYDKEKFVDFLKAHHEGEKQSKLLHVFDNFAVLLHALFEHELEKSKSTKEANFYFMELWKCRTEDPHHTAPLNQQKTSINVMLSKLLERSPEGLERLLNVSARPEPLLEKLSFMSDYALNSRKFDESLVQKHNLSYLYQSVICAVFNLLFYSECKKITISPLGSFTLKTLNSGNKTITFDFEDQTGIKPQPTK